MANAEGNGHLIEQLGEQTQFISNSHSMMETAAAREIIEQGEGAVPMLLKALREGVAIIPAMTLLAEITDHTPIKAEDRGRVKEMVAAWLEWGEDQGY